MTRSAADAAVLLQVMSGNDPKDSTSLVETVPNYSELIEQPLKDLSIGVVPGLLDGVSSEILDAYNACQSELKALGATFQEVELPHHTHSVGAYYVIAPAECSANLSRYDGARFGHRCDNPRDLQDLYLRSREEVLVKK